MAMIAPSVAFVQSAWKTISKEEADKIMANTSGWYKNISAYSVTVTHSSFVGTQATPYERKSGYFKMKGKNYHSYMLGIHSIQNEKYHIVVDSTSKTIMVNNPQEIKSGIESASSPEMMKLCEKYSLLKTNEASTLKLSFKKGNAVEAYELKLNKDNSPAEIIIYYAKSPEKKQDVSKKPRLKIAYSNYKKNITIDAKEFDISKYVTVSGNNITPTNAYKEYKIADVRVKK